MNLYWYLSCFNCLILMITILLGGEPFSFTSPPTGHLMLKVPSYAFAASAVTFHSTRPIFLFGLAYRLIYCYLNWCWYNISQYRWQPSCCVFGFTKNTDKTPTDKHGNIRNEWLRNGTRPNLSYNFYVGKGTFVVARLTGASFL